MPIAAGIGALLQTGLAIIDKVIPDPAQKAAAQLEMLRLQQAGEFKAEEMELQVVLGQQEINKVEAASSDVFRGGWRPGAGWICVVGIGFTFLVYPPLVWLSMILELPTPPKPDTTELFALLSLLLGLGTTRMLEKFKGVA